MAVVSVVVHLSSWRVTHQGGFGPVVALVSAGRRGVGVVGLVFQRRTLVLFTLDATHRRVCRKEEGV